MGSAQKLSYVIYAQHCSVPISEVLTILKKNNKKKKTNVTLA